MATEPFNRSVNVDRTREPFLMIDNYTNLHAMLYKKQGFVLLPDCIPQSMVISCKKWSLGHAVERSVPGNDEGHSWTEIPGPTPFPVHTLIEPYKLNAILSHKVERCVQWVNIYSEGQYIEAHRDAGGDSSMLTCVSAPSGEHGGHLWLHEKANLIPMAEGDCIIFDAKNIRHGTTTLSNEAKCKRIILATRMWF
jgi:hypothetical protein